MRDFRLVLPHYPAVSNVGFGGIVGWLRRVVNRTGKKLKGTGLVFPASTHEFNQGWIGGGGKLTFPRDLVVEPKYRVPGPSIVGSFCAMC